ncbi:MAG: hypothetical protein FWF53_06980 [Candidatus Azobacteroides sp.]|nr:hypothetical protein [Candidatus Azobacteroides sp.]
METKLIFLISFLAGMISFSSCEKKNFNEMPPETQTGKNTFGCLIDGELFVGGCCAIWMQPVIIAEYYTVSDKLGIVVWGKMNGTPGAVIRIGIDSLQQNSTQKVYFANYIPAVREECPTYSTSDNGICTITKLDTLNKIVSGRFEFAGRCTDSDFNIMDSTEIKQITQGRFDLKLDVINE